MNSTNYSFLKNYFTWATIALDDETHPLCNIANEYIKEYYPGIRHYSYASIFYEKDSNLILGGNPDDLPVSYKETFEFFLEQLPSLQLSDVSLFLDLIHKEPTVFGTFFQLPIDYPSTFCKDFLKDTYGYIVYNYHFMQLIQFCLPFGGTFGVVNEYRNKYNKRTPEIYQKLEKMYLPDGSNLGELLKRYTIKTLNGNPDYGFVSYPRHDEAYHFIVSAQKYL